jgi:allophanate hydrolase subunit 2
VAGAIEVVRLAGLATVQDGGRPGRMHEGVPPGGALAPELLAAANRAAHNPDHTPAIEVFGALTVAARGGDVVVAGDNGSPQRLAVDATFDLLPGPLRVHYLAVSGGLCVPRVLGGYGTLLGAGFGGHEGRALRRGDLLGVGVAKPRSSHALTPAMLDTSTPIRVVLGPDLARFEDGACDALLTSGFTVAPASDRTGTRLVGPLLRRRDRDSGVSGPMVRGAIEVPLSGDPIVLGPDHPTTGGYPVLAVLARADWGRFFARPLGSTVRFQAITLEAARMLATPGSG